MKNNERAGMAAILFVAGLAFSPAYAAGDSAAVKGEDIKAAGEAAKKVIDTNYGVIESTGKKLTELYPDLYPEEHMKGVMNMVRGGLNKIKQDIGKAMPREKAKTE